MRGKVLGRISRACRPAYLDKLTRKDVTTIKTNNKCKMQSLRTTRAFPSRFVKTVTPRIHRPYSTPTAHASYEHIQFTTPKEGVALSI